MPFRKIKVKDSKTGKPITDENGEFIYKDEEFLPHFTGYTKEDAENIYKSHKNTIELLANKYSIYTNIDIEDLVQEGIIGLARAIRDWEPNRSETFKIFAIYKIKDAMREYSLKQSQSIRIPQYIKDASVMISKLCKLMDIIGLRYANDVISVWKQSEKCSKDSEVIKDITIVRQNLLNLANRSHTTVKQLLKRAELYSPDTTDIDDLQMIVSMSNKLNFSVEDDILSKLTTNKSIAKLKAILSEDDYNLLYQYYVEGKTVRDLESIVGIKAASITVKIHNILKGLQKKKDTILMT